MKKYLWILLGVIILGFSAFAISGWKVKSSGYSVKFAGGKIKGEFKGLKANISFDPAHPQQAKIWASINANSISTGFFIKNSHAKSALDAEKYPTISFRSTTVNKSGNGYQAAGKLTLKGISKPVTIHFTFNGKGRDGVFKGSFKIAPKEFNITRNGTPDVLTIYLNVPVTKL
jgi:polyisoprenoid-binding protein YceI